MGFSLRHLLEAAIGKPKAPAAPKYLSVKSFGDEMPGGFTFATPDKDISRYPYPSLLRGLMFGNNRNPVGRGVPLLQVRPPGGFVPQLNLDGGHLKGRRRSDGSYDPVMGWPRVDPGIEGYSPVGRRRGTVI